MSLLNYIAGTSFKTKVDDIKAYNSLVKEFKMEMKNMRIAYKNITVEHKNTLYISPLATYFAGCVQKFLCWEYDDEMRNDVAREYVMKCPYNVAGTQNCPKRICEYYEQNQEYNQKKKNYEVLKEQKKMFWKNAFARCK